MPEKVGTPAMGNVKLSAAKKALLEHWLKGPDRLRPGQTAIPRLAERNNPPLSFAQERLWFLHQFEPESTAYNIPRAYRLTGPLDVAAFQKSLEEIVSRHEILRTNFQIQEGMPVQVIAPATTVMLPLVDFSQTAKEQQDQAVQRDVAGFYNAPFDLSAGSMFRVRLIRVQTGEHLLLFNFHHAVFDGWSLAVFIHELSILYACYLEGRPVSLPPLSVQYADYAVWQRKLLQGSELERHLDYWRQQLANAPVLELPTDRPRPPQQTFAGARHVFRLNPELAGRLKTFNQREGVTAFMTLLGVFQVLLSRYSGQQDILVGTPIANRQRVELEELIGFFVNTLVLRCDLSGEPDFCELVKRIRGTALDAYQHQDLPFEKLVQELNPVRDQSRNPLFQVVFAVQNTPKHSLELAGSEVTSYPLSQDTLPFDLEVYFWEQSDGWLGVFMYNTNLFDLATIERMAGHYLALLDGALAEPKRPVWQLPMLSAAERDMLLVEWNRTARDYPRDTCVHRMFEKQVEQTPGAVALVFEEKSLTYRELDLRANELAHHLRRLGVGPGALVGLGVERSLEMLVAVVGILKSGGAYWALEQNLPEERLGLMLADARPRVLLVRRSSFTELSRLVDRTRVDRPDGAVIIIAIEDLLESSPPEKTLDLPHSQAGDPAYVSYTSGSTGRPKGVVVPHRGVVRLVKNTNYVTLNGGETLLHHSPLSFDASTFEIWGALLNGGRVVLLPPGPLDVAKIGAAIRQAGVTTLWLTAGLFQLMVDDHLDDLKPLRQLLAGGDVLSPEHVRRARRALPFCRIINGYGPTENTTFTCCYPVEEDQALTPSVPIGRPIANTQVYVLDSNRQPVPVGVAGELYAGGDGLACGYLHQPQLTAERFIPDPFRDGPDARLYRTGDRVRWRSDGNLEFLGRLDSQVKMRGFRIELGEIESVLRLHPAVREAFVMVREDPLNDKRLVAYLVAKLAEKPDRANLRACLAEQLPEYMLPSDFIWLDQLPLTPNGKVNRQALPEPKSGGGEPSGQISRPVNLLELELLRIWQRLFQREQIDRLDNFFAVGGHSLMAARLATEIEKLIGCNIPIATLFQSPTIESLARRLTDEKWSPPWSSLVPLQPTGSKPPLFLIHGWGGDVFVFLELVKLLPSDQPVYGIQAVGLDGQSTRHMSVEEMAAHYVKEMVSLYPIGPLNVVGFSLGGAIAFEVAQQLNRLGRRVALLALLDPTPTGRTPWFFFGVAMAAYLPGRCKLHLQHFWHLSFRERLNYVLGRWVALRKLVGRNRSRPRLITTPLQQTNEQLQKTLATDYYRAVAHSYHLQAYPGTVDIFVSEDANHGWRLYWKYLARGGVTFHPIYGGHIQILTSPDHLPALAKTLTTAIRDAQEREGALHTDKRA